MIFMRAHRWKSRLFSRKFIALFFLAVLIIFLLSAEVSEEVSAEPAVFENQGSLEADHSENLLFQVPSLQERVSQALAPVPQIGLDPHYSWEQNRSYLLSELYYYLYEYDHLSQEIKPQLAEELPEVQEGEGDSREYIFKVSSGYRFASGREIEARDVKYSLMRLLILDGPDSGAGYLWQAIFGESCLAGYIREKTDYGSPENLSSQESLEVYSRLTERIFIRDDKLTIRPAEDYDLSYLLSDLAPWAAVVDHRAVKALGGWDGRPESWAFYHRTRRERRPPLQESNKAGRYELRVINYQPGRSINLQRISEEGERAGIIAVFAPGRAGVARGIRENLYNFIQLTTSQEKRYRQDLKDGGFHADKLSVSDSKIYLVSGEKYLEEQSEIELIYYQDNQEHSRLAQEVEAELETEGKQPIVKGLNWQSLTSRLYRGDFELAIMEWLHPFPPEVIPEFIARDRHLAENVEVLELLEESRRYLYGELLF